MKEKIHPFFFKGVFVPSEKNSYFELLFHNSELPIIKECLNVVFFFFFSSKEKKNTSSVEKANSGQAIIKMIATGVESSKSTWEGNTEVSGW